MKKDDVERAMKMIEATNDPEKLRQIAINARRLGQPEIALAADLKRYAILPSDKPGTLAYDVWKSIFALEDSLSTERSRTTRLNRTRPKIKEVGELEAIKSLIMKPKPSEGFFMLIERGMPELTFEAVALRHPEQFDEAVIAAAKKRLSEAGVLSE